MLFGVAGRRSVLTPGPPVPHRAPSADHRVARCKDSHKRCRCAAPSVVVVSLFAVVFMHGAWALRLVNPVFSRHLGAGLPGGPNALLTGQSRSSGRLYRMPVATMEFQKRRFVRAAFGEVGWVRNLRAAGPARITNGRHPAFRDAVELTPETARAIMREALAPYRRWRTPRPRCGRRRSGAGSASRHSGGGGCGYLLSRPSVPSRLSGTCQAP